MESVNMLQLLLQQRASRGRKFVAQVAQLRGRFQNGCAGKQQTRRHLGFATSSLLTEGLQVRVLPGEPNFLFNFSSLH